MKNLALKYSSLIVLLTFLIISIGGSLLGFISGLLIMWRNPCDPCDRGAAASVMIWSLSFKESNYLSTANISETNLLRFIEIKGIKLLPIQSKDNLLLTNKDKPDSEFGYLQFSSFKVKENKVTVSLTCYFESGNIGGNTFEFTKDSGKWTGKIIDTFAAAS